MASSSEAVGGRSRTLSGSSASLPSPPKSIEKSDNTYPVTLQGGRHGAAAVCTLVNRTNNLSPQQAGGTEVNLQNNENVCERVPIATTVEEKHTTILHSSYVDKSTAKAEGAVSNPNGSETGVVHERSEDEVQTHNRVAVMPPLESSQDKTEAFEELESWRSEGSPDRFSDAIEEQSYEEDRSSLVTGRVLRLPCSYILANRINNQAQNNLVHHETQFIFPPQHPHSSEQEPSSENIPLPFMWQDEH